MVMKKWKKPQFLTEAFFNGFRSGPLFACLSSRVRFGLMVNGLEYFFSLSNVLGFSRPDNTTFVVFFTHFSDFSCKNLQKLSSVEFIDSCNPVCNM